MDTTGHDGPAPAGNLNIPSPPPSSALVSFARVSGLKIAYPATLTEGKTSSAAVNLTAIGERDRKQAEIEDDIRKALAALPGACVEVGTGGTTARR